MPPVCMRGLVLPVVIRVVYWLLATVRVRAVRRDSRLLVAAGHLQVLQIRAILAQAILAQGNLWPKSASRDVRVVFGSPGPWALPLP
jgi:hypothetical protein